MSEPTALNLVDFEQLFVNNSDLERVAAHINRFNPIRVMRMENMEIRHSAILAWLLDPLENHGLNDSFLRSFLAEALKGDEKNDAPSALDVLQADLRDVEIRREKQNIDIFISSPINGWGFVIENKFHSKQGRDQLKRYIDRAEAQAKQNHGSFKNRGIFLTLNEEDPNPNTEDSYVTLRYSDVCDILTRLIEARGSAISKEIHQFLKHYVEIITEASGMNDEANKMAQLAKKLYRSHKKVIDFVMEHGASTDFIVAAESIFGQNLEYGKIIEINKINYMFNSSTDLRFSFLPESWCHAMGGEDSKNKWSGCENWWAQYPLICWFQLVPAKDGVKGTLRLFAEVGPLNNVEVRQKIIEKINKADVKQIKFRKNAESDQAKYSKFINPQYNSKAINDVNDAEEIKEKMSILLDDLNDLFNKIEFSIKQFYNEIY
jgi:PD-(D/E)XK nuclease superfamily